MGILENGYHVAWGLVAATAAVPGPGPDPDGALEAAPGPGPEGAQEAVPGHPAESLVGSAAAPLVAVEGAAMLVVTQGGRNGRPI